MHLFKVAGTSLLALLLSSICVGQGPNAAQLLSAASAQADLWVPGNSYRLEADFVTQLQKPETGHLTLKWSAKDTWRQEITLGTYQQISVRQGEKNSTARNLNFTPLPIREIQQLFSSRPLPSDKWQFKKVKHLPHGAKDCLELRSVEFTPVTWDREVCLDSATLDVESDEISGPSYSREKEFSDYEPFLGKPYPRKLKLILNGQPVLTMVITLLEEQTFTPADFTPPPNAIVRRTCDNMVYAKAIKAPDPLYPQIESQRHVTGTSIVSLTVLPDGSVEDVHLIGSANHDMDSVTQQIVKTWKFKPAMCGNEAVASDIQVEVDFRTR